MSGVADRERFRRDHRWARHRMSDYLDGELPAAARARIEHHLGECAGCRHLLADLWRTVDGLRRLPPPSAGADAVQIAAAVRARLGERG